jgi:Arc/MetJ family transcription regulator
MRTNIDIDDALMDDAIRISGEPTKRAVVERALRLLIETHGQTSVRQLRGKVQWQGDLAKSRQARAVASR